MNRAQNLLLLLFAVLPIYSSGLYSQTQKLQVEGLPGHEGIPRGTVSLILQDSQGYICID